MASHADAGAEASESAAERSVGMVAKTPVSVGGAAESVTAATKSKVGTMQAGSKQTVEERKRASGCYNCGSPEHNIGACTKPCKFFAHGTCKHGDGCSLKHAKT